MVPESFDSLGDVIRATYQTVCNPALSFFLKKIAAGYQWDYCVPTGAPGAPRSHRLQVGTGARADPETGKLRLQHF